MTEYQLADGNRIVANAEFISQYHPDAVVIDTPPAPPAVPAPRRISVGAFFDRFGPLKWAILADQTPSVKAVVQDASVRKFIDLDRPDLPAGLQVLVDAGHAIDAQAILGAEIQPQELP